VPPRRLLAAFALIIAGSLAFRWAYAPAGSMWFKYHSLSSVLYLATGAALACLAQREKFLARLAALPRGAIVAGYVVGLALLPLRRYPWAESAARPFIVQTLPVLAAAFFAFVIAEQNFAANSFYKIGRWAWIGALGRRTYGMYCYHLIAVFFVMAALDALGFSVVRMRVGTYVAVVVGSLAATLLVAHLSYRYFEAYFLTLKNRFAVITKA
jgi:peptidoglycan/LPS O-acetylase OafA/YrhL